MTQTQKTEVLDINTFFGDPGAPPLDQKPKVIYHKVEVNGANEFRFAPPVKGCRSLNKWAVYYRTHYGYVVINPKFPDKPNFKPFLCIEDKDWKSGLIKVECPECTEINLQTALVDRAEQEKFDTLRASGKPEAVARREAAEYVSEMRKVSRVHNLEKKYWTIAKNREGKWGILCLGSKAYKALVKRADEWKMKTGKHPFSVNDGLWFRITRTGLNRETEYGCDYVEIEIGDGATKKKTDVLTQADMEAINALPDLLTINDQRILNYDQIAALVASKGDPGIVAEVFGGPVRATKQSSANDEYGELPVKAAASPTPTPVANDVLAEIARLQALLAAQSTPVPPVTSAPVVDPPVASASVSSIPSKMTPEEFMSRFPLKP